MAQSNKALLMKTYGLFLDSIMVMKFILDKVNTFAPQDVIGYVTTISKPITKADEIRSSGKGPGIPKDSQEKIFQPFHSPKATSQNTGLGQSLSYDINSKGHGGELAVGSSNKGSIFRIKLPIQA